MQDFSNYINEKEEWVLYNITDPKGMVIFGTSGYGGKITPFTSKSDARRATPRDGEEHDPDYVAVTKKDYYKLKEVK